MRAEHSAGPGIYRPLCHQSQEHRLGLLPTLDLEAAPHKDLCTSHLATLINTTLRVTPHLPPSHANAQSEGSSPLFHSRGLDAQPREDEAQQQKE